MQVADCFVCVRTLLTDQKPPTFDHSTRLHSAMSATSLNYPSAQTQSPLPHRPDLRLPTELLLHILALVAAPRQPTPNSADPARPSSAPPPAPSPAQASALLTLAPACPLFLDFARAELLRHAAISTAEQADGLLRFLEADGTGGRGQGVRGLTVRAPRRGGGAVKGAQVVKLLEICTRVEEVRIEALKDEREEYTDGGAFPSELFS